MLYHIYRYATTCKNYCLKEKVSCKIDDSLVIKYYIYNDKLSISRHKSDKAFSNFDTHNIKPNQNEQNSNVFKIRKGVHTKSKKESNRLWVKPVYNYNFR